MPKLLVVDDEIAICDILKHFFVHQGYQVAMATSGEEALVVAATERPQLMLMDMKMPGLSGMEVLKQLRARQDPVKVVIVSSASDDQTIAEARALGAVDYIIKPFHLDYLEQVVLKKLVALAPPGAGGAA